MLSKLGAVYIYWCVIASLIAPHRAAQQCGPQWLPRIPVIGPVSPLERGSIYASIMWDPDGGGPASPRLVVGGDFTRILGTFAWCVATIDPATGEIGTLGEGLFSSVNALVVLPNGDLVAGGQFTFGSGTPSTVARWNGVEWVRFGPPQLSLVFDLLPLPNGELIACGAETGNAGILRWNGTNWTVMPTQPSSSGGYTTSLTVDSNGNIYAGHEGNGVGGGLMRRWTGAVWETLPYFLVNVYAVQALDNGDVIAAGRAGVSSSVGRWDGSRWWPVGQLTSDVVAVKPLPNGDIIALGATSDVDFDTGVVRYWNSETAQWSSLGVAGDLTPAPLGRTHTMTALPGGELFVGGGFAHFNGAAMGRMARLRGSEWMAINSSINNSVLTLKTLSNGDVLAGGTFTTAGGIRNRIARWNKAEWLPLGSGLNQAVRAAVELPTGDIIVGGSFTQAGGIPANRIARWNGTAWSALGSGLTGGLTGDCLALAVMPNGDLIAGGTFTSAGGLTVNNVARWNGSAWSALNLGVNLLGGSSEVRSLAVLPNGELVAGGVFNFASTVGVRNIARWNGSTWSPLAGGVNGAVNAMFVDANGHLIVGGAFTFANTGTQASSIARWNGSTWSSLTSAQFNGVVSTLAAAPGGGLLAGGTFTSIGPLSVNRVARWTGSAWLPFAEGIPGTTGQVSSLTALANGEIFAGGSFAPVSPSTAPTYLARWTPTNVPWFAQQPEPQTAALGQTLVYSATPTDTFLGLHTDWQLETAPGTDEYASVIDGPIPGAGAAYATILQPGALGLDTTLSISYATHALNQRRVRAVLSNQCESVVSAAVQTTVENQCRADFNGSGAVTVQDLFDFLAAYFAGHPSADFDDLNGVGIADLFEFVNAAIAGC